MQAILDGINAIIDFFKLLVDIVVTLVEDLINFIDNILKAPAWLNDNLTFLPSVILVPVLGAVATVILLRVLGRD